MQPRRKFLGSVGAVLGALCLAGTAAARSTGTVRTSKQTIRFTRKVREVTARLKIPKGRWKMIICHHSGIKYGNASTYDQEHRKRGMENGLAYHFVIGNGVDSGDGEIEIGRRWVRQIKGGHVRSEAVNEVAIGICLVGNFQQCAPTRKQVAALQELVDYLRDRVVGHSVRLLGHGEIDPGHTECPGRYFPMKKMHTLYG